MVCLIYNNCTDMYIYIFLTITDMYLYSHEKMKIEFKFLIASNTEMYFSEYR